MNTETKSVDYFMIKRELDRLVTLVEDLIIEAYMTQALLCELWVKLNLDKTDVYTEVCTWSK